MSTSSLAIGTHAITAIYSGDTNYAGSKSSVFSQTVTSGSISTSISLISAPNPSVYGQAVIFTATISPSSGPTGTVTFIDGTSAIGSVALDVSGRATFMVSNLAAGAHTITAQYSGDSTYSGSTSAALSQTVNKAGSTTTLTSNPDPSRRGQTVTFSATVAPSTATGTVQFFDGSTSLGTATLSGGTASLPTSKLTTVGTHSITARYAGDSNVSGSTSAVLTQTVTRR